MQDGAPRCSVQLDAVTGDSCGAAGRCKVNVLGRFTYSCHSQIETVQAPNGVFNGLNQFLRSGGGGQVLFRGTTTEPATVRVRNNKGSGLPAQVGQNQSFRAWVPVEPGRNTVRITARDGAGNERSQNCELVVPAVAPRVFTYDKNGNTDGRRGYTWVAENRLSQIMYSDGSTTQIGYDGFGRRVRVEEKDGQGAVTSIRRYVWAGGTQPAEERDAARVMRRFFEEGEQVVGGPGEATGCCTMRGIISGRCVK